MLWSATFALARSLAEKLGAFTAGAAVYGTATLFCVGLFLYQRKPGARQAREGRARYLIVCSGLFAAYTLLIYAAVGLARTRLQLLEVALVNYLWPAATLLLAVPLQRQRAHPLLWPSTLLALAGVFLVMTQGANVSWQSFSANVSSNPLVYCLAFIAALCWAFYSNLARRWGAADPGYGVLVFMSVSTAGLLGCSLIATEQAEWSRRALSEVFALGLITASAYALWDIAMRRGNLTLVVAASYSTPLMSTLVSGLYLRVTPAPQVWWGCLLIVLGSLASWWAIASRNPRSIAENPTL